ncbi:MAG: TIGR03086 family metal-binding protein [Chloroflexota bacterium]|jgi:uncharacterized protein (TIGR03086 family)|nr:TIGR03086 family metal-binding protein [Chloroflexota bacterium]
MSEQMQNQTQTDPLSAVRQSDEIFRSVLKNVTREQLDSPTVNDLWDLRRTISHVIWGNYWAAGNLRTGNADYRDEDAIGDRDPMEVYVESFDEMIAAANEPGNMERTLESPFLGGAPASLMITFRESELVHHAWDVAKATGQDCNLAPELCTAMLNAWQGQMETEESRMGQFKMPAVAPEGASPADKLNAYLGKPVG